MIVRSRNRGDSQTSSRKKMPDTCNPWPTSEMVKCINGTCEPHLKLVKFLELVDSLLLSDDLTKSRFPRKASSSHSQLLLLARRT